MPDFTLSASGSLYTSPLVRVATPPAPGVRFWRVKHDIEIGKVWRAGMPQVHPLSPKHFSPFQKWAQFVSRGMNPWMADDIWTKIYHAAYWMSNGQGFGMADDPRANFVTGENVTKELPGVSSLLCAGSMVRGERSGDWVTVQGLHYDTPVSLEYLQAHPEFWVRGVYAGGTGQPFRMLGHKFDGPPLIHPLIINKSRGNLVIEAYKLQEWTSPEPPDALRLYL